MPKKRKVAETYDEHLGDAVESFMHRARLTQTQLATAAGMPMTNLGRAIRGTRPLLVGELTRVAGVLNVPSQDILDDALERFGGIEKLLSSRSTE